MRTRLVSCVLASASLLWPAIVGATEPWSDADPASPPSRIEIGDSDYGLRLGSEYRAQWLVVDPIALASETDRRLGWIEHRFRLDVAADWKDTVKIVTTVDALDGTLWGDNGNFGENPSSNYGTNVGTKAPNETRPCVTYRGGAADPLQPDGYGYGLCANSPFRIRKLYGEVVLPFGVLRIGRQPANIGAGVQSNDGEGRRNRFGISRNGNFVDRILFATKPLEALKPEGERNKTDTEGLIIGVAYDRLVTDNPQHLGEAVHQLDLGVRFLAPEHRFGSDLLAAAYYIYRWDKQYGTRVHGIGMRTHSKLGDFWAGLDVGMNLGTTREIAEGYRFITNDPVVDQTVRQFGARAVVRYDQSWWTAYFEFDYASGQSDPTARKPLTQFLFAEDTNVGLLLFEHVLAFQSARASAAGVETLHRLGAKTNAAEAVDTRGSFTNALAIFPQFDVRPHPDWIFRGGVLMAWAAAPVMDPIATLLANDGVDIHDHAVNFAGGKPARYYGTEIDGRIRWQHLHHFNFDLEGALLFPGEALQNENGKAVRSGLVTARATFFF